MKYEKTLNRDFFRLKADQTDQQFLEAKAQYSNCKLDSLNFATWMDNHDERLRTAAVIQISLQLRRSSDGFRSVLIFSNQNQDLIYCYIVEIIKSQYYIM
jgi:hypothetical protein